MSSPVRLTLVSHARTAALRTATFALDEPLDEQGSRTARDARGCVRVGRPAAHGCARRTRQTAEALGLSAVADPGLRDLDVGSWRGRRLDEVAEEEVHAWLTDPAAAPHGGESILDLLSRVGDWLQHTSGRPGRHLAVTHPAVVRAVLVIAMDMPPAAFWRIDVPPLSVTSLHARAGSWTLRQPGLRPAGRAPCLAGPPGLR